MENLDLSKGLLKSFEDFQKILLYRRETLLNLPLSQLSSQLLTLFRDPGFSLGDLFLEFLMRLSYALYLKSKLLLNFSEEVDQSEKEEEAPLEAFEEKPKRDFLYLWGLSLERVLEERVFLPRVDGFESSFSPDEKGDINILIGIFLRYLEKLKQEPAIKIVVSERNIEDYLEDLREFVYKERLFTWEEFLRKKQVGSLLEIIFYFLSLLFLVFYGECRVHQDERGIIQIFLKE